jgi:hypothetical protein
MKFLSFLILSAGLLSCGRTTDNKDKTDTVTNIKPDSGEIAKPDFDYDAQFKLENYLVSETLDSSKVQTINFDCSLLIYPTEAQIEQMKKTEGEENFYVGADDSNFYQSQAIQILDSLGIKSESASRQFIKFVGVNNSWTLDIRKKNLPAWNLILFKKDKTPEAVPTISLTVEKVKDYFDKK